jgi:CHAD domain-containing protein
MIPAQPTPTRPPSPWAVTDSSDTPIGDVSGRVLRQRLEAVQEALDEACLGQGEPKHIHRLRVSTRRALATISAFRDLLPRKRRRWFERSLRRIRRAAGAARDLDVIVARFGHDSDRRDEKPDGLAAAARHRLAAMLSREQIGSRQSVVEIHTAIANADWHGRVNALVGRISTGKRGQEPLRDYAQRRLRPLLRRFFNHAKRSRLRDEADLHHLRLEGKRLRYTLEIFASVFPDQVRARFERSLESMQERLGEFTDHATAANRMRSWAHRHIEGVERSELVAIRKQESVHAARARRAFVRWWSRSRRRALQRRIERTLRRVTA